MEEKDLKVSKNILWNFTGKSYELDAEINIGSAKKVGINFLKSEGKQSVFSYDVASNTLSFDWTKSGHTNFHERVSKCIIGGS